MIVYIVEERALYYDDNYYTPRGDPVPVLAFAVRENAERHAAALTAEKLAEAGSSFRDREDDYADPLPLYQVTPCELAADAEVFATDLAGQVRRVRDAADAILRAAGEVPAANPDRGTLG